MVFKINDLVSVLDDAIDGKVIAVEEGKITIETSEGFPMVFTEKQLVKTRTEDFHFSGIHQAIKEKEIVKRKIIPRNVKERDEPILVIDLHIEKLVKSKHGMSNYDILSKQLDVAKYHIELAIKQRAPKLVLVHGVGDGVLKADIYAMLKRYDRIQFYEASYQKYGQGATEIRFLQSKN